MARRQHAAALPERRACHRHRLLGPGRVREVLVRRAGLHGRPGRHRPLPQPPAGERRRDRRAAAAGARRQGPEEPAALGPAHARPGRRGRARARARGEAADPRARHRGRLVLAHPGRSGRKRVLRAPAAGYAIGMSVQLNHTIVSCRDQQRSAAFLTGILGLPPATRFGHFLVVEADNGVSLDFAETSGAITAQHYAFLVGEEDLPYWADPGRRQAGVINTRDGGRGVYFADPDGHLLELITRPYGSGGS